MPIASLLLRTRPTATEAVATRLEGRREWQLLDRREQTLAVLLRADSPGEQNRLHRELQGWDDVLDVALVFQGMEDQA